MDWMEKRRELNQLWKKYGLFLLVLLAGIGLMLLPTGKKSQPSQIIPESEPVSLEESLAKLLSQVEGAGRVEVLLTQERGEETLYQTDGTSSKDASSQTRRQDTVILTEADRGQAGLIRRVNGPVYRGAVVVCQGGNDPTVCLAITKAVSGATGLSTDKITVLKMQE